ncbi:phage Gp37/Gp68 family protein [candidate division KSB1 bacterium]|nr:phage Gp37/Gp68 family protein [candidate division KSB1 bacterium]NIR72802.1 phage Gp37/Gp68 family protein [candidate division KSB1 bacterium]NIS26842.1 phage Gp37/Gp68 family protein [candidate division KSB1 bacterium]NIT73638.1 phage Gp37/Gp68 family protein [candidate division KSB1 bacterium]NIU27509.1 phage Gp37/Gp68 family protein [candidate division KSB1 bacterium]
MAFKSNIEWTETTWNPLTGCTKVSTGCKFCYAERMAYRLKAMGQKNYQNGFTLTLHEHVLQYPLNWKKPQVIFVNSMSDLFHEQVPFVFIEKVFKIMKAAHWHRFQVLTKRAKRLAQLHDKLEWPLNVWMGVSVEDQDFVERIDRLRETNAETKFLSLEPLLGPLPNLTLNGIDWVIVGGESGPGARKMREEWVLDILNQCKDAKVPFFFKQWGGVFKKRIGRTLENRVWNQVPDFQLNQQAP